MLTLNEYLALLEVVRHVTLVETRQRTGSG